MSHHTTTETDVKIEEILSHISENSWMNIVDLEGWAAGTTDNAESAEEWCKRNASPAAHYFKAWELGTNEASKMLSYFSKFSMPTCPGSSSAGKFFYTYKFSI